MPKLMNDAKSDLGDKMKLAHLIKGTRRHQIFMQSGLMMKCQITKFVSDYMRHAGSVKEPDRLHGLFHMKCQLLLCGNAPDRL